jgi:hydroxypyruvate isomerase
VKFLIERRLKANAISLKSLRAELDALLEQTPYMQDEAEEERLRAIVSDSRLHERDATDAERHANAFARRRSELMSEIAEREVRQDELLDQLSAAAKK